MVFKKTDILFSAAFSFLIIVASLSCATGEAVEKTASGGSGPSGSGIGEIIGREWILDEFIHGSEAVSINRTRSGALGEIFTLRFDEERVSGMAAPNRYFGPYTAGAGNTLSIGPMAGTLMASFFEPEELKEHEFYAYLEKVEMWELRGKRLVLHTNGEDGKEAMLL